jgi:LmbE family N-acetylglucosaminyl deacetylase
VRILVVAAHPDDEVLGCGGTIARMADLGHEVYAAILGEGVTSRSPSREDADPGLVDTLHQECRQAAEFLGVRELFAHGLPDNRFDTVPLLDVVKMIEGLLDDLKPETVYTQHGGDLNVDHAITHRATLTATRPVEGSTVKGVYAYEVPSSTDWAFQRFEPVFRPNVFVDVTSTLKRKLEAMEIYQAEIRPFPHPRSLRAMEAAARRWGSVIGREAAEAFELIRSVE